MNRHEAAIIRLDRLRVVEEVIPADVARAEQELRSYGHWRRPLVADAGNLKVLRGTEYYHAASRLGLKAVPVILLDSVPKQASLLDLNAQTWECFIPIDRLTQVDVGDNHFHQLLPLPQRQQILDEHYNDLVQTIAPGLPSRFPLANYKIPTVVPHPRLRLVLESDPVMASILPCSICQFSLGTVGEPPFCLQAGRLVRLSPALLDDPSAMAAAARWGMEAARVLDELATPGQALNGLLRFGQRLLAPLSPGSRALFLSLLPDDVAEHLVSSKGLENRSQLFMWLASLIDYPNPDVDALSSSPLSELSTPLEDILVIGGDSRLELSHASGVNKYGVPPRPRPEAIHFSSSTASAISDYGFMYGEMLRQELLGLVHRGRVSATDLVSRVVNAISYQICRMLDLQIDEADIAIAASGTDTELMAIMFALAGAESRRLTNILIAPEESGTGVVLAGAGCYFDSVASTGFQVEKGKPVWPQAEITLEVIGIRDHEARPRKADDIDEQFLALGREALAKDGHILAHVLWASKTGLIAPSQAAVEKLISLAPERVDIVVDACQMRMNFSQLGGYLRKGWLLQISGSKFLTGPPFSGALVFPQRLRARQPRVSTAIRAAPAVTHADAWTDWWSKRLPRTTNGAMSFGPMFRWLPALLEAVLFKNLPQDFCDFAFERFRAALVQRIKKSTFLRPLWSGERPHEDELFARLSIVSFQVLGRRPSGELSPLDEIECRWLFEHLNLNTEPLMPELAAKERMLARQHAHIGQPVTLNSESGSVTVLRMVIGARFFSIVGYAGIDAITAALESEIADAERAIAKIELLADRWSQLAVGGIRQ